MVVRILVIPAFRQVPDGDFDQLTDGSTLYYLYTLTVYDLLILKCCNVYICIRLCIVRRCIILLYCTSVFLTYNYPAKQQLCQLQFGGKYMCHLLGLVLGYFKELILIGYYSRTFPRLGRPSSLSLIWIYFDLITSILNAKAVTSKHVT